MISVQVQIREMDGATTGKGRMEMSEDGHVMIGQTPLPMRNKAERPIERLAYAVTDKRSHAIRP
jgi:hypothetical protein